MEYKERAERERLLEEGRIEREEYEWGPDGQPSAFDGGNGNATGGRTPPI